MTDLAQAIGRPDWAGDARFATPQGWLDHLECDIRPAMESGRAPSKREARRPERRRLVAGPCATDEEVVADRTWRTATCLWSTPAPTASRNRPHPRSPHQIRGGGRGTRDPGALARRAHRRRPSRRVGPRSGRTGRAPGGRRHRLRPAPHGLDLRPAPVRPHSTFSGRETRPGPTGRTAPPTRHHRPRHWLPPRPGCANRD